MERTFVVEDQEEWFQEDELMLGEVECSFAAGWVRSLFALVLQRRKMSYRS